MSKSVLVPFDDSPLSTDALEFACEEFEDADITVLTVLDFVEAAYGAPPGVGLPEHWETWHEEAEEAADERLDDAAELAAEHGVDVETRKELGPPARVIANYADEHDVDHVVMGSHGRTGVSRVLLGSVAESVMRRAPVPVTIVR